MNVEDIIPTLFTPPVLELIVNFILIFGIAVTICFIIKIMVERYLGTDIFILPEQQLNINFDDGDLVFNYPKVYDEYEDGAEVVAAWRGTATMPKSKRRRLDFSVDDDCIFYYELHPYITGTIYTVVYYDGLILAMHKIEASDTHTPHVMTVALSTMYMYQFGEHELTFRTAVHHPESANENEYIFSEEGKVFPIMIE